jgi:hypothetical protein
MGKSRNQHLDDEYFEDDLPKTGKKKEGHRHRPRRNQLQSAWAFDDTEQDTDKSYHRTTMKW